MTTLELRRRRAFREAWADQSGRCVDCGCDLSDDAVLDGVVFESGTWVVQELRCPDCAGKEVVWELDLELARQAAANAPLDR